jgi:tetratricopeptide (TPR) repeat protein
MTTSDVRRPRAFFLRLAAPLYFFVIAALLMPSLAVTSVANWNMPCNDYNSAIALQPNIAEAWYDRVTTLANLEQYDRAIADLSEAIRLKLDFALAYCNRGASKFSTGQFDEAFRRLRCGYRFTGN